MWGSADFWQYWKRSEDLRVRRLKIVDKNDSRLYYMRSEQIQKQALQNQKQEPQPKHCLKIAFVAIDSRLRSLTIILTFFPYITLLFSIKQTTTQLFKFKTQSIYSALLPMLRSPYLFRLRNVSNEQDSKHHFNFQKFMSILRQEKSLIPLLRLSLYILECQVFAIYLLCLSSLLSKMLSGQASLTPCCFSQVSTLRHLISSQSWSALLVEGGLLNTSQASQIWRHVYGQEYENS